jgi:hypothetical protein
MAIQGQAGDIVRLALRLSSDTTSALENVWHFILSGTGNATAGNIVDSVGAFADAIYGYLDTALEASVAFDQGPVTLLTWVVDKWLNVGDAGDIGVINNFTPAETGDPLPDATSLLLRFLSDTARRTGAKYFGGFTEAANGTAGRAAGAIVSMGLDVLNEVLDFELAIPDSDLTLEPVILSPTENIWHYPTAGIVRAEWAYQRRRKSGIGV